MKYSMIKIIVILCFLSLQLCFDTWAETYPKVIIKDQQDQLLPLVPEPLDTFVETPIKKTKTRINSKYGNKNFFSLYMLNLNRFTNEEKVKFHLQIGNQPLRINFISINQKTKNDNRELIFHESLYLDKNETINTQVPVYHKHENLSFIIAEQLDSKTDISPGVRRLLNLREKQLVPIVDFGTNWNMSELNLEFDVTDTDKKKTNVEISFDQLLEMFSHLKWIIAIRTSQID
jgi:hypothetical protein